MLHCGEIFLQEIQVVIQPNKWHNERLKHPKSYRNAHSYFLQVKEMYESPRIVMEEHD